MGHERVGQLPRTQRWAAVVDGMTSGVMGPAATVHVANATLQNVRDRLRRIERDSGVAAAVQYLIALSHGGGTAGSDGPVVPDLAENPPPARLALALGRWVDQNRGSPEYAEIAKQAAADTIADWSLSNTSQEDFFPQDLSVRQRWLQAGTGAGFCEVARRFFASFTERYLRYFLDREASASIGSVHDRERFSNELARQVDGLSRHAFETSKITQSFAAGWYHRYARGELPSGRQLAGLLRLSFQKIREELEREAEGE